MEIIHTSNKIESPIITENTKYIERPEQLSSKIKKRFNKIKQYTLAYLLIGIFNICSIFLFPILFWNTSNIAFNTLLLAFSAMSYYRLKEEFNIVDDRVGQLNDYMLIANFIVTAVYVLDVFYILIFKILSNLQILLDLSQSSKLIYTASVFYFLIYLAVNSSIPILILVKLYRNKHTIRKLQLDNSGQYSGATQLTNACKFSEMINEDLSRKSTSVSNFESKLDTA